ncbi:hypothetical protein [Kordia jejudonensis]|uniref:hypothetical protein n=1 Tax=Kordia jejudonensis TaxID=1348245 RepID=UPI0012E00C80|nr:hypothetical protein [Kordia jejudonensis]
MKKRTLKNLNLNKKVISNLEIEAVKGMLQDSGSGDTHPDYSCHPETCNGTQ